MFFQCRDCGKTYPIDTYSFKCKCGGLFMVNPDAYNGNKFIIDDNNLSLWRYHDLLPLKDTENRVTFGEGMTPLIKRKLFGKEVYLKLEFVFPTGSFKDRGGTVLVSLLKEIGVKKVVEDSSGNAGASIAAYCAAADIDCDIYLPQKTSEGKIKQIRAYGANIVKIPGSRDRTSEAVLEAAGRDYYASHSYNPLFFEGTKTFAFEVWEQLGRKIPDAAVIPVGNGTLLLGTYYGFKELMGMGLTDGIPRILAVQSENCCPLYREFYGLDMPGYTPEATLAEGIAIGVPTRKEEILEAVRHSKGEFVTIGDREVEKAMKRMALTGIYVEPTSATAVAALQKSIELGYICGKEAVVVPLTGHGLKKGC